MSATRSCYGYGGHGCFLRNLALQVVWGCYGIAMATFLVFVAEVLEHGLRGISGTRRGGHSDQGPEARQVPQGTVIGTYLLLPSLILHESG